MRKRIEGAIGRKELDLMNKVLVLGFIDEKIAIVWSFESLTASKMLQNKNKHFPIVKFFKYFVRLEEIVLRYN